jgi:phosphoribosylformimino-5-aminoimidazole carboxamide ribonucleotide (ProFAR) isomerase
VGGGVRTVEEIRFLMSHCCADKVVIGYETFLDEPKLGYDIMEKFGASYKELSDEQVPEIVEFLEYVRNTPA